MSLRLIAGGPVALVDHAGAECPGLDQVQRDVVGDRWQERRAATDDDRISEHAQLVDEAELDRLRAQAEQKLAERQQQIDAYRELSSSLALDEVTA